MTGHSGRIVSVEKVRAFPQTGGHDYKVRWSDGAHMLITEEEYADQTWARSVEEFAEAKRSTYEEKAK